MNAARNAAGAWVEPLAHLAQPTRFGWMSCAASRRGLCWLGLFDSRAEALEAVRREFPRALLGEEPGLLEICRRAAASALAVVEGRESLPPPLDLRGTAFQLRVWGALGEIPRGALWSYGRLAESIGRPRAVRAVARACAANRVSILAPCHRVVGAQGALTGYRWGIERKRWLLEAEGAPLP